MFYQEGSVLVFDKLDQGIVEDISSLQQHLRVQFTLLHLPVQNNSYITRISSHKSQGYILKKNKKTGKNLEGRIGEKEQKGKKGKKRREKGRKEENRSKKEGKYPYFISLFNIGPYCTKTVTRRICWERIYKTRKRRNNIISRILLFS